MTPRTRIKYMVRVTGKRLRNRWYDARARLSGYCNDRPWSPIPGEGGGYAHWRCALNSDHSGLHRYRNYTWGTDGRTTFSRLPVAEPFPAQPKRWERSMTKTLSQARALARWHREQRAATR